MLRRHRRRGVSLLEVLIALAIFLGSMIAIGRLVLVAGDRAAQVRMEDQATLLCQSKLAEVAAGVVPLSSQGGSPFDEAPEWQWSLQAEQGNVNGLWHVEVKVSRPQHDGTTLECTLRQYLLDPSLRGSTLDSTPTPLGANSTASASSASGSSGSGAGNQAGGGAMGGGAAGGGGKGAPKGNVPVGNAPKGNAPAGNAPKGGKGGP